MTITDANPHLDHLFKIGVLAHRVIVWHNAEAEHELLRYRDEGINMARKATLTEPEPTTFSGQGILFAVIDDRETMKTGATTIDVIAEGINAALDAGFDDPESIARFLTTSAFQHIPDKRLRFNSVLKAGDVVGAQITRKLHNAYNELTLLADEEQDPKKKEEIRAEARGFAEALNVVISPFSCEDPADPRLVNWDEVDRITDAFEKEQRQVIRERKGRLQ